MNKNFIVKSLEDQLVIKKQEVENLYESTIKPALVELDNEVLNWFKETIDNKIEYAIVNSSSIEVSPIKTESGNYSSDNISIYIRNNYYDLDDPKYIQWCELSWYGSNTKISEGNSKFSYLSCLGNIASNFQLIEDQILNTFKLKYTDIKKISKDLSKEIYELEVSINSLKSEIKSELFESYKKVGFKCTMLKKNTDYTFNKELDKCEIVQKDHSIRLQIGRSNHDYIHVKSFEIIKSNKYKVTLNITNTRDKIESIEVTQNKFTDFIFEVFGWETEGADHQLQKCIKRVGEYNKEKIKP